MLTMVQNYVMMHWDELPKSTFNDDEVVIVKTICDENEGWGNHSYEGVGIDRDGKVQWCFSSGCSCSGSCGTEHKPDIKVLEVEGEAFDLGLLDPANLDFNTMETHFSDY